jgi:RNA polymerase sigma-70 factor (ECF subfamily)
MQQQPEEFTSLMQRIRAGSEGAARLLVEQYGHHILRVVRRMLHKKLRSKFDSADFQQDVWASFFANQPQTTFDHPKALAAFLAKVARNKVLMAHRTRCRFQRHNVNREHSLDGSAAFQAEKVTGREPTPSQLAVAQEKWEQLLEGQPPRHQRILTLVRQGYTQQQIAQELGVDERTVRRVIRKVAPETLA